MADIIKQYQEIIRDITTYKKNPTEQNARKVAEGFESKFEGEVELKEEGFLQTDIELETSQMLKSGWLDKANGHVPETLGPHEIQALLSEGLKTGNLGALVNAYGATALSPDEPGMEQIQRQVIDAMNTWKPHASLDSDRSPLGEQFAKARDAVVPEAIVTAELGLSEHVVSPFGGMNA